MDLTLDLPGRRLKLRANNYFKIQFLTLGVKVPEPFQPCRHLQGRRARIVYLIDPKFVGTGEISLVEVRQ